MEGIAVIGMAGRFPGAEDLTRFWENLCGGQETIAFYSAEELIASGLSEDLVRQPNYVKAHGTLQNRDCFDAAFFAINPREAEVMDPQHRLFLEVAWSALEDAGHDAQRFEGQIGLFAGSSFSYYLALNLANNPRVVRSAGSYLLVLSNDKDFMPTRAAYKLNLKGPSFNVSTACSTGLVSIHVACQSLLSHQCDMALAGGAAIQPQKEGYVYEVGGIASPDGHCRPFDAAANGTVLGSGVAVVVLRRLEDALEDGDPIDAVVLASAINNDGAQKIGFTAPSKEGQARVISEALLMSGVNAQSIAFVEAHGTGTHLGDPIEFAALTEAFRRDTAEVAYCALGSLKANVGHLDSAAGVAGFIKTVLTLREGLIPPLLHFETPNPKINLEDSPFYVNRALLPWPETDHPRRASVSSFGIGGTNAHAVLQQAPERETSGPSRAEAVLLLSAKTQTALQRASQRLAQHLRQGKTQSLADIAFTLATGRSAFNYRHYLVCTDRESALERLATLQHEAGKESSGSGKAVVFLFPGQGIPWVGSCNHLYREESAFRDQVDECCRLIGNPLGQDLRQVMFSQKSNPQQQQPGTDLVQPALFVLEYALAKWWMSLGIQPVAMAGHSVGELVAACLAGVFQLEEALALVATRGRLMAAMPEGHMLAVPLSEDNIQDYLRDELDLAAVNAVDQVVVSGSIDAIASLKEMLLADGIPSSLLATRHAFHSQMMDPAMDAFYAEVAKLRLQAPQIPFLSNVTGTWITQADAVDPAYWAEHLRDTVYFHQCLTELCLNEENLLLEVGPGKTLSSLARRHPARNKQQLVVTSLTGPEGHSGESLGQLWAAGVKVDWQAYYQKERRQRVHLPGYAFDSQRFWIDPPQEQAGHEEVVDLSQRDPQLSNWFFEPSWKKTSLAEQRTEPEALGYLLLFADEWGLGKELAGLLAERAYRVIVVHPGQGLSRSPEGVYQLSPDSDDDFRLLVADLKQRDQLPGMIIHLWGLSQERPDAQTALSRGFFSLVRLTQALAVAGFDEAIQCLCIANGLFEVTANEALHPEKASLLGAVKVLPQEHPNIVSRYIDVVPQDRKQLAQQLLCEVLFPKQRLSFPQQGITAYRGPYRWLQDFESLPLEHPRRNEVVKGGCYLILGGLGGIGSAVAEFLAKEGCGELILLGRASFPEPGSWQSWLEIHRSHKQDVLDPVSRKIIALQALQDQGVSLQLVSADLADPQQALAAIEKVVEQVGRLDGIVHAAGVAGGGLILASSEEKARKAMASKLHGIHLVEELCSRWSPSSVLYCSSLAAQFGPFGQSDYTAANALLDAHAYFLRRAGFPAMSLNWDTWVDTGMILQESVRASLGDEQLEAHLQLGLSSEEGQAVLARVWGSDQPQILVSTTNLPARLRENARIPLAQKAAEGNPDTRPRHPRPAEAGDYVPPSSETEKVLAEIWSELLGLVQIGMKDNFFKLDGNSLLGLQAMHRINQAYGLNLSVVHLYDGLTIEQVAKTVDQAVAQK